MLWSSPKVQVIRIMENELFGYLSDTLHKRIHCYYDDERLVLDTEDAMALLLGELNSR